VREFRKAVPTDIDNIMLVIEEARAFIASFGIDQWQNGYPRREVVENDIENGIGYVLCDNDIVAYAVLMFTEEPFYKEIDGCWLTGANEYATMHRTAVCNRVRHSGIGTELMKHLEKLAVEAGKKSMRADTHRGNRAMNAFLKKLRTDGGLLNLPLHLCLQQPARLSMKFIPEMR